MAKQSGLHQIRGKVGEYSYYRQTGVAPGLIRGINQGLSSRVKTGDEYANTRLNNSEFGAACNVAGILGRMVSPKYRPMILPFSQSIMAKKVLELAKAHPGLWGQRTVTVDDTADLAQILSDTSKLKISDFMEVQISRTTTTEITVNFVLSVSQVQTLIDLGISGFNIKVSVYDARTGTYSTATQRILRSSVRNEANNDNDEDLTAGTAIDSDLTCNIAASIPSVTGYVNHRFATVLIQPYRQVGQASYTLQEYCMFQTFQIPDAA